MIRNRQMGWSPIDWTPKEEQQAGPWASGYVGISPNFDWNAASQKVAAKFGVPVWAVLAGAGVALAGGTYFVWQKISRKGRSRRRR
jgi:hypothetical protein